MILQLVGAGKKVGVTALGHKAIRNVLDAVSAAAKKIGRSVRCGHKGGESGGDVLATDDNSEALSWLTSGEVQVLGGTAWLWSRPDFAESVDVLVVDEAGQLSLATTLAVSQAAGSMVLLGDPRQLEQPLKATHPEGSEVSALEHVLGHHLTIASDRGLFLGETRRLHPTIAAFTSELFYESRLGSLATVSLEGEPLGACGLWLLPVRHEGNQTSAPEEVEAVASLAIELVAGGARFRDERGVRVLQKADILIVAPYNAQVLALAERLPGYRVGTVDKFQGQEAPVVIISMTSSSAEDAPRGMEFLYSPNRLNVATSRAQAACVLVASPRLFEPECKSPRQVQLANALCRYAELARRLEMLSV